MKKLVLLLLAVLLLTACAGGDDDIVEIPEQFFVTQIQSLHVNAEEYVGRTIRYEGIFQTMHWDLVGSDVHLVYRYVWDCCGNDGEAGFWVHLGGIEPLPDNAWVEVTGVLEWYEVAGFQVLRVAAASLREMEERGAEVVMP